MSHVTPTLCTRCMTCSAYSLRAINCTKTNMLRDLMTTSLYCDHLPQIFVSVIIESRKQDSRRATVTCRKSPQRWSKNSFGWSRLECLGALGNSGKRKQ